ncbi:hypothetical protein HPB49_025383 [Dermacentor silvarum]|uniref:Uncharacterized protein n=1 Tax=Dermacentor silvarum TaxID=543639 RepID=A0ACB8DS96_DERSI|nr:hypothetical protein HPB49_025383 [Dermacentor silvarum]
MSSYVRRSRYHLHFAVIIAALVVVVVVAVVSLAVFSGSRKSKLRESSAAGEGSFCCPEDAWKVSRFLNTSLDPCKDFYARVCTDVIRYELWKRVVSQSELEHVMVTGVVPHGLRSADTIEFLTTYYKSCIETIPHKEKFVSELARALARSTSQFLGKPDYRNVFAYAATVSLKYRLSSIIKVAYEPKISVVELSIAALCTVEDLPPMVLTSSVNAVADTANASVTPDQVVQLTANICSRFLSVREKTSFYGSVDDFNKTVWNVDGLRSGLNVVGYTITENTRIHVKGVARVRAVLDFYMDTDHHGADGAKAAYLLLHSVASGMQQFYSSHNDSWRHMFQICNSSVQQDKELWDMFTAQLLITPEKDKRLHSIFIAVRDAVYRDCRTNPIFDAEDAGGLGDLFEKLFLELPTDASRTTISVPKPRLVFAENLLKGRSYDFYVRRERQERTKSQSLSRALYIPPVLYDLVRAGSATSAEIPNMAALGWWLAQTIWYEVLNNDLWLPKTKARIQRLHSCFHDEDNGSSVSVSDTLALGLSSVLKAFSRPDWDTVRPAWSLMRMSHGELFYSLGVYYRCPLETTPEAVHEINAAMIYAGDFASVFRCPADSPMAVKPRCTLQNVPAA